MKPSTRLSWIYPVFYIARYDGGMARADGLKELRGTIGSQVVGCPTVKTNLNYFHVTFDPRGIGRAQRIHSNGMARAAHADDAAVCDSLLIEIGAKKASAPEATQAQEKIDA